MWKVQTVGWNGQGVVCGKPAPSRLWPPPVSIKDRWVGPCEQVLNIPITCWWYEPSKSSSLSSIEAWLKPTASLVGLGEKLGIDPRIGQPTCRGLCHGLFFLRVVGYSQKIAMHWPREIRMVWDHTRTERGMRVACWSGFPLQGVYRFESPRLSDMSTTCLWQSSRSNLMNLTCLM
jgi:hypothetical protein